jgi:class 3 adenylate cyclase
MLNFPRPVLDYIQKIIIEIHSPAYFFITKNGHLLAWGGSLETYKIINLEKGQKIETKLFFLQGILPLDDFPVFLQCIEIDKSIYADIHIFSGEEGDWILLLDATLNQVKQSVVQQKGNELSLVREKQSKLLAQYLGKNVAESLAQGTFAFAQKEERSEVSILFADIRGFTSYSETQLPETVFKTLNLYLPAMIQPILEQAGMVDKLMGDAVMGIFGVLPATDSPEKHSVKAALQMIEAVNKINQMQQDGDEINLKIGVGIATGAVALGILGSKDRRTFTAIGHHVNLAARMESQARPNEILIDEDTFAKIEDFQTFFSTVALSFKGIAKPLPTYSWLVK